jgi:hypothetical protein
MEIGAPRRRRFETKLGNHSFRATGITAYLYGGLCVSVLSTQLQ